jgi:hypothetical protein
VTPRQLFVTAYHRIVKGLGVVRDDEQFEECWTQAQRFDPALFDAAATRLLETAVWMPKPAEWARACADVGASRDQQARDHASQTAAAYVGMAGPYCGDCRDTGFRKSVKRPGYVTACECCDENPVIQARRHGIAIPGDENGATV